MQPIDKNREIGRKHLDQYFDKIRAALRETPKRGWIHEVRTALLMTTAQLAKLLGIPQSNVSIFEKAERNKKITLHSLERIADALDCNLRYVLIPKKGLESTLSERAKRLYERDQRSLEHQMSLEGQGTKKSARRALEIAMLVANKDKRLWEDLE